MDEPSPQCGLVSPLLKVRPFDTPLATQLSPPPLYKLSLARNEYESFQIICVGPLEGLDIAVALPPSLVGVAPPPQLHSTLYYTNSAGNLSDCIAKQGAWPDPLVPFTDPFVGEARNRTTTIAYAQSRGFWVDLFAPASASSGSFSGGAVTVNAVGMAPLILPFTVTVLNFTLPQTSPYATAFGFFKRADDTAPNATSIAWADLHLMHRITVDNVFTFAPQLGTMPPDLVGFEAEYGAFLTGRRTPFGLDNTTVTAFRLPSPFCNNFTKAAGGNGGGGYCGDAAVNASVALWRALYNWADERGFAALLFDYTVDEPQYTHTWAELKSRGAAVHAASPALRVLTTITMDIAESYGVADLIDLWVPQINDVAVKGACYKNGLTNTSGNQRPMYNNVSLRNLWWYQACPSHGCDGGCEEKPADPWGGGYWNGWDCESGWPSYMIDHSTVLNRIHPWATYLYDVGGELYWGTNWIDSKGGDAWKSQWEAGGNGDGTLSYRGTPDKIGGKTEIPIASVRLKAIRDGQEDLLYMAAAEKVAGRAAVLSVISNVLSTGVRAAFPHRRASPFPAHPTSTRARATTSPPNAQFAFSDDPVGMARAREALGALAEGAGL